ncbi:MAG: ATP-grasp domain-containing protein, partial [Planctomycetota bacterium]
AARRERRRAARPAKNGDADRRPTGVRLQPPRPRVRRWFVAVSVAVLCGPGGATPLAPCRQRLSTDGRLRYLGGGTPILPGLAERAGALAAAAVEALPQCSGYVGVDLVLGDHPDGRGDRVIEVNPRLTTSYVGLRVAAERSLAGAMIDAADGKPVRVPFSGRPIAFDADGSAAYHDDHPVN